MTHLAAYLLGFVMGIVLGVNTAINILRRQQSAARAEQPGAREEQNV